jgi:hypothetical protein
MSQATIVKPKPILTEKIAITIINKEERQQERYDWWDFF